MSETRIPIPESAAGTGPEMAPERGSRWQVAWRALRHRNFQLFFSGQLISLIGTWMQSVAQVVACLPDDGFSAAVGISRIREPIPCVSVCAFGRDRRRSLQPAPHRDRDADRVDATGLHPGSAHALPQSSSLACVCARESAWGGECVRHSRTAIVPGRHGGQGRSDERDRAEFFDVQWCACDRSGDCRDSSGKDWRRLVLLCQRGQLHRGDYRIAVDAGDRSNPRGHGLAAGAHDGGVPLRATGPRRFARCCCCWDW